jgi:hypothetical protein
VKATADKAVKAFIREKNAIEWIGKQKIKYLGRLRPLYRRKTTEGPK